MTAASFDRLVAAQKVLDLHGINVLAAGDDDVFFSVDQIDEAVFVASSPCLRYRASPSFKHRRPSPPGSR